MLSRVACLVERHTIELKYGNDGSLQLIQLRQLFVHYQLFKPIKANTLSYLHRIYTITHIEIQYTYHAFR